MLNLIRLHAETMNQVRPLFTAGELSMILDIMNGTYLDTLSVQSGAGLDLSVSDSFALYPSMYEEKWKVEKEPMLKKIRGLSEWHAACLAIWAADFWESGIYAEPDSINLYIQGRKSPAVLQSVAVALLEKALEYQDKFKKTGVKSQLIAEARTETAKAIGLLTGKTLPESPAAIIGRKGGAVTSEAKTAAARQNAKKGGRPKKEMKCEHRTGNGKATENDMEQFAPGDECLICECTLGADGYWYVDRDQAPGYPDFEN